MDIECMWPGSIHDTKVFANSSLNQILPDPNLDLLCVWQSDAAPFCENYTKLYFHSKHLEKRLNTGWWNFYCTFFQKKCPFWPMSDAALIF